MKRFSKILTVVLTACLLCGIVLAIFPSAETAATVDLTPDGVTHGNHFTFDTFTSYSDTNADKYTNAKESSTPGNYGKMRLDENTSKDAIVSLKSETVDGRGAACYYQRNSIL